MVEEDIARICHAANAEYCRTLGDNSQPSWQDAPDWQKKSAVDGVNYHLNQLQKGVGPKPSQSHESWLAEKTRDGWKYGPVKNPAKKEHPCFVPYDQLPRDQKVKDYVFAGIVRACFEASCGKVMQYTQNL